MITKNFNLSLFIFMSVVLSRGPNFWYSSRPATRIHSCDSRGRAFILEIGARRKIPSLPASIYNWRRLLVSFDNFACEPQKIVLTSFVRYFGPEKIADGRFRSLSKIHFFLLIFELVSKNTKRWNFIKEIPISRGKQKKKNTNAFLQEEWDSNPWRSIKPHSVSNATDYNRTFVPSFVYNI